MKVKGLFMPLYYSFCFRIPVHRKSAVTKSFNSLPINYRRLTDMTMMADETTSEEQNPIHQYKDAGKYVVVLWVEGPAGKSRHAKVWDVAVK